jgi:aspartyl aminopeptidase
LAKRKDLSINLVVHILDVGNPQLSMHSIREVGGTEDIPNAIKLFDVREYLI